MNYGRIGLRVKALLGATIPPAALFLVLDVTGIRSALFVGLAMAVLSVIVLAGLNHSFIVPLKRLREAIALVEGGRFEPPAGLKRRDEFGELAESIGEMYDRLEQHALALEQRIGELTLLHNISKVASSTVDLDEALMNVLESAVKVIQAVGGSIMLMEPAGSDRARLKLKVSLGMPVGGRGQALVGEEIAKYVAEHGGPLLLVGDIAKLGFHDHREFKDAVYAPIRFGDATIGVIGLVDKQSGNFDMKDLQLLLTLANHVSGLINRARLFDDLQASYFSTVQALSAAIDAKDPHTRGHSGRVVKYSQIIARSMGHAQHDVEAIKIAAYLHDIGKIGIDERILLKPLKLTKEEFELVKKHSSISAKILARVSFLKKTVPIVRHHHEHFDGGGYPDGLAGTAIPLGARIISVADSFDAMTSDRPYRQALTKDKAINELKRCAGTQFDPDVVDVFINHAALAEGEVATQAFT